MGLALGDEAQFAARWVVVWGRELYGGAGAQGEVAAEEQPEPQGGVGGGEKGIDLLARCGYVAGPDAGVGPDLGFEARSAVEFPEPAQDAPQCVGFLRFGLIGKVCFVDLLVEVGDVGGAEPVGR